MASKAAAGATSKGSVTKKPAGKGLGTVNPFQKGSKSTKKGI